MRFEFSAGVIVYLQTGRSRRFLVLRYEGGHWDFPKGHIEPGELVEEAALRETMEETGLIPQIHQGFKEKLEYFFKHKDELVHKTVYFFIGRASGSKVTLSHEHIGFDWLPLKDALSRLSFANAREMLEKADGFIKRRS